MRSLHISGEADAAVPPAASASLAKVCLVFGPNPTHNTNPNPNNLHVAEVFADSVTVLHSKGHQIPRLTPEMVKPIKAP